MPVIAVFLCCLISSKISSGEKISRRNPILPPDKRLKLNILLLMLTVITKGVFLFWSRCVRTGPSGSGASAHCVSKSPAGCRYQPRHAVAADSHADSFSQARPVRAVRVFFHRR
jgi:hypothetical protein